MTFKLHGGHIIAHNTFSIVAVVAIFAAVLHFGYNFSTEIFNPEGEIITKRASRLDKSAETVQKPFKSKKSPCG